MTRRAIGAGALGAGYSLRTKPQSILGIISAADVFEGMKKAKFAGEI
jgi:hypothetical protein